MLHPSSREGLTYSDALRLLGANESHAVSALGMVAGLGAGATSAATLSSIDFFALRDEAVKWGNRVVRDLKDRLLGLSRYDRTQRLVAAHSVIVISSFFEAMNEALSSLGISPAELEVTVAEQTALAIGSDSKFNRSEIVSRLVNSQLPMPSPSKPFESVIKELSAYYTELLLTSVTFIRGLAAGESVSRPTKHWLTHWTGEAVRRYEVAYRTLAAEVREFAIWAAMTDTAAGRVAFEQISNELRQRLNELQTGLAGVRELLENLGASNTDAQRADLVEQYRRELARPILDVAPLSDGIVLPSMRDLYINPSIKVRIAGLNSPVATEAWWARASIVTEIQPFLAGYLTNQEATAAPLVILGEPGSGKSLLTRALAANLPLTEFLPIRVELRSVAADAPIQDQIEAAVYLTIGERVSWPELVRSTNGAMPVVMLDGFDELLQASGTNRANYLEQVREFQQREAELGRPVAVLVTTRTVVADRVRTPEGSTVIRLMPFNDERIARWVKVWADTNAAELARRSLAPINATVALRYRDLAEQPLLLLLLALYDAWDNRLQCATDGLDRAELYERLFTDFARRELHKREPNHPPHQESAAIEREVRRLSIVALAMFNRGAQVITEEQLNDDLSQLLGDDRMVRTYDRLPDDRLTAAQLLVGRFFFIHESRARRDTDSPDKAFEFLHATFGEFLVSRVVVETLVELVEERAHQARRRSPGNLDVGFLYATLSFAVLTSRTPIFEFCQALLCKLSEDLRAECRSLLTELLHDAGFPHPTWSLPNYQPVRQAAPARYAAYTANLVILLMLVNSHPINLTNLFDPDSRTDGVGLWRSHALLWESQLPRDSWSTLWQTLRVTYEYHDDPVPEELVQIWWDPHLDLDRQEPVQLYSSLPPEPRTVLISGEPDRPFMDVSVRPQNSIGTWLRESAFRLDRGEVAMLARSISPYWRHVAPSHVVAHGGRLPGTDTQALLELLLAPRQARGQTTADVVIAYKTCFELFGSQHAAQALIMRCLIADAMHLDPEVVANILYAAIDSDQSHRGWVDLDGAARVLAILHHRMQDAARIREIYRAFEVYVRTVMNPDDPGFWHHADDAFSLLGSDVPT